MKLYHYIKKGNNATEEGILSFSANPQAEASYYFKRTGGKTKHSEIVAWMENCFVGRSRGIRCFSEPIKWTDKSIHLLKNFVDNADMFEIDVNALVADGLIEAIYVSPALRPNLDNLLKDYDEELQKLNSVDEIDFTPVDWSVCDDKLGLRFAVVPYYLLIMKNGTIPPQYIKKRTVG